MLPVRGAISTVTPYSCLLQLLQREENLIHADRALVSRLAAGSKRQLSSHAILQ